MENKISNEENAKLSVEAAENIVGAATLHMDKDMLQSAQKKLNEAKSALENTALHLKEEEKMELTTRLQHIEHQLNEAKN